MTFMKLFFTAAFILIGSQALCQPVFSVMTVDTNVNHAAAIAVADFNLDGLPDMAAASWGNPPSSSDYRGVRYCLGLDSTAVFWDCLPVDTLYQPMSVEAADIDGDSLPDIAACSWNTSDLAWWKNSGGKAISWTKYEIDSNFTNAHEIHAVDLDKNGHMDIIAAAAGINQVSVWYSDGSNPPLWNKQVIDSNFGGARSIIAADFDGDGDLDLAGAALTIDQVAWWRNDGGNPVNWTKYIIDDAFDISHRLNWCDMDKDGRIDLVGASYGGSIAWWHNTAGSPIEWVKQEIQPAYSGALVAHAADLDGDGDLDVMGTNQPNNEVCVWINGGEIIPSWTKYTWTYSGPWPILPYDLNHDGAPDMVTGGYQESSWFKNKVMLKIGVQPGFGSILPGDSMIAKVLFPLRYGNPVTVNITTRVDPLPAVGALEITFDRITLSSPDSCLMQIKASPDVSPGRYMVSLITSDAFDTLTNENLLTVEVVGQGQAVCVGASSGMMGLVRSIWSSADSLWYVPSSLESNYQALVIEDNAFPADTQKIRNFIENGGRVLTVAGTPYDLCGGTNLAGISSWLGASTFAYYTGGGMNIISNYDDPFGLANIDPGDTLGVAVSGFGRLSGLTANGISLAHLGTVTSAIAGLYCHFGSGHNLYYTGGAGISSLSDSLLTGYLKNPALGVIGYPEYTDKTARPSIKTYPNPMAGRCRIDLLIPAAGPVEVAVYDITGGRVADILRQNMAQGLHTAYWNGLSQDGSQCPSGVYFIKCSTPVYSGVQKLLMIK